MRRSFEGSGGAPLGAKRLWRYDPVPSCPGRESSSGLVEVAQDPVVNQLLFKVIEHPEHLRLLAMDESPKAAFLDGAVTSDPAPLFQGVQEVWNLCWIRKPVVNGSPLQTTVVGVEEPADPAFAGQAAYQLLIQVEWLDHRQSAFP